MLRCPAHLFPNIPHTMNNITTVLYSVHAIMIILWLEHLTKHVYRDAFLKKVWAIPQEDLPVHIIDANHKIHIYCTYTTSVCPLAGIGVTVPPRTAVRYLKTNCQQRTELCVRPFIHYIQLLALVLIWNLFPKAQWTFNAQNVIILCRQFWHECSAKLATAQWTLQDVGNCVIRPVWIHHGFRIPTDSLSSLCVACFIVYVLLYIPCLCKLKRGGDGL
jgi:hypothetical protein